MLLNSCQMRLKQGTGVKSTSKLRVKRISSTKWFVECRQIGIGKLSAQARFLVFARPMGVLALPTPKLCSLTLVNNFPGSSPAVLAGNAESCSATTLGFLQPHSNDFICILQCINVHQTAQLQTMSKSWQRLAWTLNGESTSTWTKRQNLSTIVINIGSGLALAQVSASCVMDQTRSTTRPANSSASVHYLEQLIQNETNSRSRQCCTKEGAWLSGGCLGSIAARHSGKSDTSPFPIDI